MYANGQIPAGALKSIPGNNAGLLKPYAYSYLAMHYESVRRGYGSLAIYDGSVGRTYRSYARQLLAKRVYGPNAAWPGTSNHGLAKAVDLMTRAQRRAVDAVGAKYGWAKIWSDAAWEWWHMRGVKGMAAPKPKRKSEREQLKGLGPRQTLAAQRLLYHRREMAREKRSGEGPRFRKQLKYARDWKEKLEHYRGGKSNATQKKIIDRVLAAKDGRL